MPYEETQKGNPYQLTKKQHIFPESCIKRFTNPTGQVQVFKKLLNLSEFKSPGDSIFCAKRLWDQKAEAGSMKAIEDKFKDVVETILGRQKTINDSNENAAIEDFFALWSLRVKHDSNPIQDPQLQGVLGTSHTFTQDDEEKMEKAGVVFIRQDGTIPSRFMTGDQIMIEMMHLRNKYKNNQWVLIRSLKGEFIIPDSPYSRIIPITPIHCLGSEIGCQLADMEITENQIKKINLETIKASRIFYFAKDLSCCPR